VIHVDIAPHLMMGTGKGAECYIQGDAALTAREIEKRLGEKGVSKEGFRTAAVRKALLDAARDSTECEIEPGTVDPREAARVMDERLPSNVGVVVGDGHFMSFPIMLMKKRRDMHVFSTAFGSIGQGLATGIGAAVATGEPLLCIEGDGGALQNIQELDTARRLGVKLLYVVMNDDAYGAEFHKLKVKKLDAGLAAVPAPDFGAVGRGFGCRGRAATSTDEIASAIDEFLAGVGPMVLDVKMSRNVISIPYRRMHLGQDV
jgi:thiamine pyrophosphate-dependent acetolactate synthase large subunit-like protein